MKSVFSVPSPHETNLPLMSETTDINGNLVPGIQYLDSSGVLCGGWWCIGEAPKPNTVLVCIDSTEEFINEMANDPKYLYVGDVVDEVGGL